MVTALGMCLFLLQTPSSSPVRGAPDMPKTFEARLQAHVEDYQFSGGDFLDALLIAAAEYKIPMGIVLVGTPSATQRLRFSKKDATVQEIIQALVETQPGYKMEVGEGLVHIFPRTLVPDRENFLSLKVPDFEVRNQVVELAERRLHEVVNATVWPPKPQPAGRAAGGTGSSQLVEVGDPELTLRLENSTVQDVLDALTLASGRGVWIVTFAPAGSLTPTGYRETGSPIGGEAGRYAAKPYWEILKWGRKPW